MCGDRWRQMGSVMNICMQMSKGEFNRIFKVMKIVACFSFLQLFAAGQASRVEKNGCEAEFRKKLRAQKLRGNHGSEQSPV